MKRNQKTFQFRIEISTSFECINKFSPLQQIELSKKQLYEYRSTNSKRYSQHVQLISRFALPNSNRCHCEHADRFPNSYNIVIINYGQRIIRAMLARRHSHNFRKTDFRLDHTSSVHYYLFTGLIQQACCQCVKCFVSIVITGLEMKINKPKQIRFVAWLIHRTSCMYHSCYNYGVLDCRSCSFMVEFEKKIFRFSVHKVFLALYLSFYRQKYASCKSL